MSSDTDIIIRNMDRDLFERIKYEAECQGTDVAGYITNLVKKIFGVGNISEKNIVHHDLDYLGGTWSNRDGESFTKNISDFETIDEYLWK